MQINESKLNITHLQLKNFRCFTDINLELHAPLVLLKGPNGIGKTSLLEALHYACYLRSFRTHLPRDLISFGKDSFFVKVSTQEEANGQKLNDIIQVGFTGAKRLVKVNQKTVGSYKELMGHYRVVSLTEDDLELIKGNPQVRRTFIDQAILLSDPEFITMIRDFKTVLENRNSMLQQNRITSDSYEIWTHQLWEKSLRIQEKRKEVLTQIEQEINALLHEYFDEELTITLQYAAKKKSDRIFDELWKDNKKLLNDELRFGRSLFGAHLDDLVVKLQGKRSKSYASRGQQKLIVLLIKVAQIKHLSAHKGPAIFLLDDFMTDFDQQRASKLFKVLVELNNQLIFTSPATGGIFEDHINSHGGQIEKFSV